MIERGTWPNLLYRYLSAFLIIAENAFFEGKKSLGMDAYIEITIV